MKKTIFLFAGSLVLLGSCGGNEDPKEELVPRIGEAPVEDPVIDFNIPSPSEQFSIFSKLDGQKNTALMHDPELADSYAGSARKALNFGVYTADLAYLTSYGETNRYLSYFGKLEKLGDDIGVSQVFGKELEELAKKWDGNADSLFSLSDRTYNRTFEKLREIGKGEELSLMLMGGWIESLHLMLGSTKGYSRSPELEQAIADQKLVAENLNEFMMSYQDDPDVAQYKKYLVEVLGAFEGLACSTTEPRVENTNGKLSFSGGESCRMTEKCFNDLKKKVQEVRTTIITN